MAKNGKEMEHLGTEKLSGEVSTPSKKDLLLDEFINDLNKISHKMIDLLRDRKIKKLEDIQYYNSLGRLAQAHFIPPLFYLCSLSRYLNEEEWKKIIKFWLADALRVPLFVLNEEELEKK